MHLVDEPSHYLHFAIELLADLSDVDARAARPALPLARLVSVLSGSLLGRRRRVLLAGPAVWRVARLRIGRFLLIQLIELPREIVQALAQFLRARQIRRQLVRLVVALALRRRQRIGKTIERSRDVFLRIRRSVRRGRRRVLAVRFGVGLSRGRAHGLRRLLHALTEALALHLPSGVGGCFLEIASISVFPTRSGRRRIALLLQAFLHAIQTICETVLIPR